MTCVEKGEDPITAAQDILALSLVDLESENKNIPTQISIDEIKVHEQEQLVFVNVWMPYHRSKVVTITH